MTRAYFVCEFRRKYVHDIEMQYSATTTRDGILILYNSKYVKTGVCWYN